MVDHRDPTLPQDESIQMATNAKLSKLLKGRKVDSVRQREKDLDIDFDDGSTLSIVLESADSSVTLMNSNDKEEYTG